MDSSNASKKTKRAKLDLSRVADYRRLLGENQTEFWSRFGVTQSGGSRYESGRAIPKPVRMLLSLHADATVTDDQLRAVASGRRRGGAKAA